MIEDIMIDCGLPYKKIEHALKKVKVLLITHGHSDHVKKSTLESIRKHYPRIKICGNYELAYEYGMDIITNDDVSFEHKNTKITPFKCFHDCECQGFVIERDCLNILYATDTNKIVNPLELAYDYIFLESNYDEEKIAKVIKENRNGYSPYKSAVYRHLSTQACKTFYYLNRKSKESLLVELHKSKRFY